MFAILVKAAWRAIIVQPERVEHLFCNLLIDPTASDASAFEDRGNAFECGHATTG